LLAADWGLIDATDGFLLLAKNTPTKTIPDAFYNFARAQSPIPNPHPPIPNPHPPIPFGPLTATGIEIEDWPRWRQTKVTTFWQVGPDFVPGSVRPWLELRTPGGDTVYTFDQVAAPALVWYPPDRWQPGETLRLTTLWLFLPPTWGAVVGAVHGPDPAQSADRLPIIGPISGKKEGTVSVNTADGSLGLLAVYQRWAQTTHLRFPTSPAVTWLAPDPVTATFTTPDGTALTLTGGLAHPTMRPGQPLDIWLTWGQDNQLPPGLVPFIHLRQNGQTVAQSDGPPRFFVEGNHLPVDWRQLTLPADATPGDWQIVVGLYNPTTGTRAEISGTDSTELLLAHPTFALAPIPDQACALIPATCVAQE
nr:hypothetical protein [Caldilineaceae bacterium]